MSSQVVQLHPIGDCYVNGVELEDSTILSQGDTVQFGDEHLMRFNHPTQVDICDHECYTCVFFGDIDFLGRHYG